MKPITISELLQYSTVKITASNGSTGTGFFFNFVLSDGKTYPVIITNKHVVSYNPKEIVTFFLHTKNGDEPEEQKINVSLTAEWHFHKDQDLCFCFLAPLLNHLKTTKGKEIFNVAITEDLIWDNKKLEELSAIEDIIMVGYPIGLRDEKHNLPLFRKGITSSHPAIDFNKKNIGVIDAACFPGSSGSPIFVLNENGYTDKSGTFNIGKRIIFLGVLFQGPQRSASGKLIITDIPTKNEISPVTPMMINLGYYIKAMEVLMLKDEIQRLINENTP